MTIWDSSTSRGSKAAVSDGIRAISPETLTMYVARVVMKNIIQSLSEPENAAMVSIFVPGELVMAAGLTPYSVEAMSCFMAGTKCEQTFLRKTEEEGFAEIGRASCRERV